jgi:hypothetical protein
MESEQPKSSRVPFRRRWWVRIAILLDRLVELYAPLIWAWLRRYDVQDSDANDLVQEVLLAVSKDLGKFEHAWAAGRLSRVA